MESLVEPVQAFGGGSRRIGVILGADGVDEVTERDTEDEVVDVVEANLTAERDGVVEMVAREEEDEVVGVVRVVEAEDVVMREVDEAVVLIAVVLIART